MCLKFQPETILAYAAAEQMSDQDKQYIPQAIELIRDKPLRNFRVDIAADSLVQLDEAQMKQDRMQFLQAFGGFMNQTLPVVQAVPALAPAIVELMKFGIQAFKESRSVEGVLTAAIDQLQENGAPNPQDAMQQQAQAAAQAEQQKAEALMQAEQTKMQMEQAKMQADMRLEQAKMQQEMSLEQQRQQFQQQLEAQKMQQEAELAKFKANLDAATKVMVARISANPGLDIPMFEAQQQVNEKVVQDLGAGVMAQMDRLALLYAQMANDQRGNMAQITAALASLSAPKRIVRGVDGRAVGVEPVQPNLQ